MKNKLSGWEDTIVALVTPPGIGAIGVIRISGVNAIKIIDQLFPSKNLSEEPTHTLHIGYLKDGENLLDEVVVSVYKNPKSFTGEDVAEISCHGSAYIQQQVIKAIINKGARLAKPGEFTQRAFLNGKLDLTQAEAVADLIASNTEASRKAALNNIRGGFSEVLKQLREQLIRFSALVELELDFGEEDVEFADRQQLLDLIEVITTTVNNLIKSFALGNVIKNGVSVAIAGKPNAGKSTLLNTFLNENRVIVSEIAGTTRDTIEEILNINGILFRLIDTAGIRENTTDVIEILGVSKSLQKIKEADIVLYLFDKNFTEVSELASVIKDLSQKNKKFIIVANKADIEIKGEKKFPLTEKVVMISAKEKTGIEELKNELYQKAIDENNYSENVVLTNTRHLEALQNISTALLDIKTGLCNKLPGDLLAIEIRHCLYFLGEITGEITNEDQLDYIFSKFCIGK